LAKGADVVYRGDRASGAFVAFWLVGARVVAGMNANTWDVNEAIQVLIRDGVAVDRRALQDPDVPLDQVATITQGADTAQPTAS
jgi:3-phenylpropionate/trans-cinnamate dioxygenase ferredoxin reductase subunit